MVNVSNKDLGSFIFFFSVIPPDSQLLQEAATRLNYRQGSGQAWLVGAALGARGAALLLGCDGAIPAVPGVHQNSSKPSASGKCFPRKFKKHSECLCLLKSDI